MTDQIKEIQKLMLVEKDIIKGIELFYMCPAGLSFRVKKDGNILSAFIVDAIAKYTNLREDQRETINSHVPFVYAEGELMFTLHINSKIVSKIIRNKFEDKNE